MKPLVPLALLLAALALPAGAHAAVETLELDAHEPAPGAQATAIGATALAAGGAYLVTVTGTYSIVRASRWALPPVCGTPLAAPLFATLGIANGEVGTDAELQFARTAGHGCSGPYPRPHNRFQIDVGNGFRHVVPEGGPFEAPAEGNRYRYRVTGTGAPARFRLWDEPASDNYGVLRIVVAETDTPADPPSSPGGGAATPDARRCLTRRVLRISIGSGAAIRRAKVTIDGRRWGRVRYARRVTARVDLRRLRRASVDVRVRVLTRDGRRLTRVRAYATCAHWT
jgi:hypothetical protein